MRAATARPLLPMILAVALPMASTGAATGSTGRSITIAGVSLHIPAGWHARLAATPACDPERLIVASSTPIHIGASGRLPSPPAGSVLVVLLEDRYRQDRPVGDLHRPHHFSVAWNHLAYVKPSCGLPASPAYMRYFEAHGRYLGFIVYPGAAVGADTRRATITLMDSLRVNA